MTPSPDSNQPSSGFQRLPWQDRAWAGLWRTHQAGRFPHALLITGPPGMGKLQLARNLGQALLCQGPDDQGLPCGRCRGCHLFQIGHHPDFRVVGPDPEAKSEEIRIDFIRALIEEQGLAPHTGPCKLIVITPAERMNRHAANSLLKTLEEPAPSTRLILLTARPGRLLATLRSRCQPLHLSPPPETEALAWLRVQTGLEDPRLPLRLAGGAPLAALRLAHPELLTQRREALEAFLALGRGGGDLVATAEVWSRLDLPLLWDWMSGWIADMLRLGTGHPDPWLRNPDRRQDFIPFAQRLDRTRLHLYWRELVAAGERSHLNLNLQLMLEALLGRWIEINGR